MQLLPFSSKLLQILFGLDQAPVEPLISVGSQFLFFSARLSCLMRIKAFGKCFLLFLLCLKVDRGIKERGHLSLFFTVCKMHSAVWPDSLLPLRAASRAFLPPLYKEELQNPEGERYFSTVSKIARIGNQPGKHQLLGLVDAACFSVFSHLESRRISAGYCFSAGVPFRARVLTRFRKVFHTDSISAVFSLQLLQYTDSAPVHQKVPEDTAHTAQKTGSVPVARP